MKKSECPFCGGLLKKEDGYLVCEDCNRQFTPKKKESSATDYPVDKVVSAIEDPEEVKPSEPGSTSKKLFPFLIIISIFIICAIIGVFISLIFKDRPIVSSRDLIKMFKAADYTETTVDSYLDQIESSGNSSAGKGIYLKINKEPDIGRFCKYVSKDRDELITANNIMEIVIGDQGDSNHSCSVGSIIFKSPEKADMYIASKKNTIRDIENELNTRGSDIKINVSDFVKTVEGNDNGIYYYMEDINMYGVQITSCYYKKGAQIIQILTKDAENSTKGQRHLTSICDSFNLKIPSEAFESAGLVYGEDNTDKVVQELVEETGVSDYKYTQYDRITVTGAEVMNVIEKYSDDDIAISVRPYTTKREDVIAYDSSKTGNVWFIKSGLSGSQMPKDKEFTQVSNAKNPNNKNYIDPSAQYYGIVNYQNDKVAGISFFRIE